MKKLNLTKAFTLRLSEVELGALADIKKEYGLKKDTEVIRFIILQYAAMIEK